jgi:hypothetical protein
LPQGESLITKGVQRVGNRAFVHMIVAPLDAPEQFQSESVPLLALEAERLVEFAQSADVTNIEIYGNQNADSYDRQSSVDLILVAEK